MCVRATAAHEQQATLRLGETITVDEPIVSVNGVFRLEISGSELQTQPFHSRRGHRKAFITVKESYCRTIVTRP